MNRITTEGFILHKRPFRNHGAIITLFSEQGEIVDGIVYGAAKKCLEPFTRYFMNISLREGLSLFDKIESIGHLVHLSGKRLLCGLYVNELILRLAKGITEANELFNGYVAVLTALGQTDAFELETLLRCFEWRLFEQIGYQIDFAVDAKAIPIASHRQYYFAPGEGFRLVVKQDALESCHGFSGGVLTEMARLTADRLSPEALKAAKQINRKMIDFLLEGRPLISRSLFKPIPLTSK